MRGIRLSEIYFEDDVMVAAARGNAAPRRGRRSRNVLHNNEAIVLAEAPDTQIHPRHMPQDFVHQPRAKKRSVNKEQWKRRQRSRVPRAYTPCTCRKKCGDKLTEEEISTTREGFFGIRERDAQQRFIVSGIRSYKSVRGHGLSFRYYLNSGAAGAIEVR